MPGTQHKACWVLGLIVISAWGISGWGENINDQGYDWCHAHETELDMWMP